MKANVTFKQREQQDDKRHKVWILLNPVSVSVCATCFDWDPSVY
jgi:hypothetical protein